MADEEPNQRILIVDDEVDICDNLSDILTDFGYTVDTAQDPMVALQLVQTHHYDIVLLDLRMPGMDGLELYRRIKRISAGTAALIITAYASSETAKSALAAGACQLVSKPVNIQSLLSLVRDTLESPLVLVVDDDSDLCDNLWEIFHEQGCRVYLANNVGGAQDALKNHQFQLVLLDMKLPDGNGTDVLKTVRETNPDARTVVITGYADEMATRVEKALADGASAVALKPFDVPQLLNLVTTLSTPHPERREAQ